MYGMCILRALESYNATQLYWLQCALYALDWCNIVLYRDSHLM